MFYFRMGIISAPEENAQGAHKDVHTTFVIVSLRNKEYLQPQLYRRPHNYCYYTWAKHVILCHFGAFFIALPRPRFAD